jgi:hypothetical protein
VDEATLINKSVDCASLAMFFKNEIDEMGSMDGFKQNLNMLLLNRVQAVKDFRQARQRLMDDDIKRDLIEKCAADIMCDLERLTDSERTKFDAKYGNLVEEMMV